jgi:hypothetical protein
MKKQGSRKSRSSGFCGTSIAAKRSVLEVDTVGATAATKGCCAKARASAITRVLIFAERVSPKSLPGRISSVLAPRELILDSTFADRAALATDASRLLGIEGEAAAVYFRNLPLLFTDAVKALPEFAFERRNRRPPADPVNARATAETG